MAIVSMVGEAMDLAQLENPRANIPDQGGDILIDAAIGWAAASGLRKL